MSERADLETLAGLVPPGSRVLDLGCGDGELLAHLQRHRGCSGYGIEIADANVLACMPVTKALPYQWYDTPNIRVGTHADFDVLARKLGLHISDSFGLQHGRVVRRWPNLMASVAVFRFERA